MKTSIGFFSEVATHSLHSVVMSNIGTKLPEALQVVCPWLSDSTRFNSPSPRAKYIHEKRNAKKFHTISSCECKPSNTLQNYISPTAWGLY